MLSQWTWKRGVLRDNGRRRSCESHCAGTCPFGRGAMSGSMSIKYGIMISPAVSQDQMTRTLQACAIGDLSRGESWRGAESGEWRAGAAPWPYLIARWRGHDDGGPTSTIPTIFGLYLKRIEKHEQTR